MCDSKLRSIIESVVSNFVVNGVLFTALDVSNKVKETVSSARHREVRDEVRQMWLSDIEPNGYGRSPITVNLSNGTSADALLYHPLGDSWDLDNKYDVQQRAKTSMQPLQAVTIGSNTVSVSDNGTIVSSPTVSSPVAVQPVPVQPTSVNAKDLWNNLFQVQPSLFPRR